MKKTNSKLINLPKKIKQQNLRNHQGLHFLSMQVIFSLHEKTLAEDLVETRQYPEGLNFKISNNQNRDFDFCKDIHFTKQVTQLETIIDIVNDIVDNLSEDYNHVSRILVSLYYL